MNRPTDTSVGNFSDSHIRKDIPSFDINPYGGDRYQDLIPDTLDLQERMALAVNGLTAPTDPDKDYLLYFRVNFRSNPPSMSHGPSDICQTKFMEALPLMRLASGSTLNDHVDPVWMGTALRMIGTDGLAYWPTYPWAAYPDWCEPCEPGQSHYSVHMFCGWTIQGLAQYHRASGYEPAIELAGKLSRYIVHHGEYYGPNGEFLPNYAGQGEAESGYQTDDQGFNPGPPPVNNLIHFQHHN